MKKWGLLFLLLGAVGVVGCGAARVNQIFVRVPTQVRIDLKGYDRIFVSSFLVYKDFQNVMDDPRTDYGREVQVIVRNELESYLGDVVVDYTSAILTQMETHSGGTATSPEAVPAMPDLDFWTQPERVLRWVETYLYPEIARYPLPGRASGAEEAERQPRTALVFGVLQVRGIDRTMEMTRRRPSIPGALPPQQQVELTGRQRAEFSIGLRLFLIDVDEHRILHSEYRQDSLLLIEAREMELGIFYALMDRILPRVLSAIVPVYVTTQRILIEDLPGD